MVKESKIPRSRLAKVLNGQMPLSLKDARLVSYAFGTSQDLWVNLQKLFDGETSD